MGATRPAWKCTVMEHHNDTESVRRRSCKFLRILTANLMLVFFRNEEKGDVFSLN